MCSLSYIPSNNGFCLNHNRDEIPYRLSSSQLIIESGKSGEFYFPKDLKAGGTWMAAHQNGMVACLLNGGSVSYLRKLPYKKSRGTVIIDLMQAGDLDTFKKSFTSEGIEPFTLVLIEQSQVYQLSHDPARDQWHSLDPGQAHFWSSTKLYPLNIREARRERFYTWLKNHADAKPNQAEAFHLLDQKSGGLVLPAHYPLHTVSFCQFEQSPSLNRFRYRYLEKGEMDEMSW